MKIPSDDAGFLAECFGWNSWPYDIGLWVHTDALQQQSEPITIMISSTLPSISPHAACYVYVPTRAISCDTVSAMLSRHSVVLRPALAWRRFDTWSHTNMFLSFWRHRAISQIINFSRREKLAEILISFLEPSLLAACSPVRSYLRLLVCHCTSPVS